MLNACFGLTTRAWIMVLEVLENVF